MDVEEEAPKSKPTKKAPVASKADAKKPPASAKHDDDDMEESSSDGIGDADDGDDGSDEERELDMETFDTQALVRDEADRKYLESLPEFEREAILGERFEKLKAEQDMKKALRDSKYV